MANLLRLIRARPTGIRARRRGLYGVQRPRHGLPEPGSKIRASRCCIHQPSILVPRGSRAQSIADLVAGSASACGADRRHVSPPAQRVWRSARRHHLNRALPFITASDALATGELTPHSWWLRILSTPCRGRLSRRTPHRNRRRACPALGSDYPLLRPGVIPAGTYQKNLARSRPCWSMCCC